MSAPQALICDAIRTPFGRYGGALSSVRADDLAAIPIAALVTRNPRVDWNAVGDVVLGCANQAGEDNRNVARMALLLAGLPQEVPGSTINRLCGSGLDAVGTAARAIKSGEAQLMIAGGTGWGSDDLNKEIDRLGLRDVVSVMGQVSGATLSALYRDAGALFYPSLYEGFGFPILEAMTSGCPVVTSNRSSMVRPMSCMAPGFLGTRVACFSSGIPSVTTS